MNITRRAFNKLVALAASFLGCFKHSRAEEHLPEFNPDIHLFDYEREYVRKIQANHRDYPELWRDCYDQQEFTDQRYFNGLTPQNRYARLVLGRPVLDRELKKLCIACLAMIGPKTKYTLHKSGPICESCSRYTYLNLPMDDPKVVRRYQL